MKRSALIFAVFAAVFVLARSVRAGDGLLPPAPLPEGVTPAIEKTIEKGLEYLAKNQQPDGSWVAAPGRGGAEYRMASTGLVGLAFLAHGDTPTRGKYAPLMQKITDYFIKAGQSNGLITSGSDPRSMFGHAFAMTYLAQVYGEGGDVAEREKIRKVLKKAVDLTARSQTDEGGWGYTPNPWEDEGTLTVTQLQALRSCRDVGIPVSNKIIEGGVNYIRISSLPDGRMLYRPQGGRESRDGVTCAGLVALWNAGEYESEILKRTRRYIEENLNDLSFFNVGTIGRSRSRHAEYVTYYLAQAKWIIGGSEWLAYYKRQAMEFVKYQRADGNWLGNDASQYGFTFGTAVALIVLQLPYEHLPVYQR